MYRYEIYHKSRSYRVVSIEKWFTLVAMASTLQVIFK
jgi:hypothetical protein